MSHYPVGLPSLTVKLQTEGYAYAAGSGLGAS